LPDIDQKSTEATEALIAGIQSIHHKALPALHDFASELWRWDLADTVRRFQPLFSAPCPGFVC
jgi:hypothetical protein